MAYVEPSVFDDKEIILIYVAGNTSEARKVEASLTDEGVDYTLAAEPYLQLSALNPGERTGVGIYVLTGQAAFCRNLLKSRKLEAGLVREES